MLFSPGDDVHIHNLVELTEGYSGAEICALCKEAAIFALRESISANTIQMAHFKTALSLVKPRLDTKSISHYNDFASKFF